MAEEGESNNNKKKRSAKKKASKKTTKSSKKTTTNKKARSKQLPTPNEMREFSERFDSDEWRQLVENQTFLNNFPYDIQKSRTLAEKILAGKDV